MKSLSKKWSAIVIPLFAIAFIQIFFSVFYQNDKSSIAINFVELIKENKNFSAKGMPCYNFDGTTTTKSSWAEEPPVFHLVGLGFKTILPSDTYIKIYPVVISSLMVVGLVLLFEFYFPSLFLNHYSIWVFLFSFLPIIHIHFAKFIPDLLAFTLMVWSMYFYEVNKYFRSWILALLGVTAKILAIVGFFFYFLGKFIFNPEKINLLNRIKKYSMWGFTTIFALLWFVVIYSNHWDSPFFQKAISFSEHTGGTNFTKLFSTHYWARYLTFVVTRGVSWPIFLIVLFEIFLGLKNRKFTNKDWAMFVYLLESPLYWILIRAQSTDPWKTFYIIIPFIYFALRFMERQQLKIRYLIVILVCISSFSLVKFSTNISENVFVNKNKLGTFLACDYFEANRRAKLKEGK